MNIKELLPVLLMALLTTWGIQYLFFNKPAVVESGDIRSGQSFVAPKNAQELKPLNTEIDFIDDQRVVPEVTTEVETEHARLVFSNHGAILKSAEFKRVVSGEVQVFSTVNEPAEDVERERGCLLLALGEKTPFYYEFVERQDTDDAIVISYAANTDQARIKKDFIVSRSTHQLDVKVSVEPRAGNEVEARLFYPAPMLPGTQGYGRVAAITTNEKDAVVKTSRRSLDASKGWFAPTMFGAGNRYFVHTMFNDADSFVQRAYYLLQDEENITSILEGPRVTEQSSWTVSLYFGPKEEGALAVVDPRLDQTLDYSGLLAPISKLLLKALKIIYEYVGNYGLAILLLTLLIKLVMLPFTMNSERGMAKHKEMQRKLKYVEDRYKDDPEMRAREKAELVRKNGLPGLGSCLPMLANIPIFIGLNRVLGNSIELYRAPFGLWIQDLSAPDPYYTLPLLLVVGMLAQAAVADKKQQMTFIMFALIFGSVAMNLSAGVCLYIVMSTILGVAQTKLLKRSKAA